MSDHAAALVLLRLDGDVGKICGEYLNFAVRAARPPALKIRRRHAARR
jgi:hypothetical protein